MSVNLTLAFDRGLSGRVLCYERLRLDWQDYAAFDRISADAIPLLEGVHWYGDEGLRCYQDDPYGAPLTWMPAHALNRHLSAAKLHGRDLAVLKFIQALAPGERVILWWH